MNPKSSSLKLSTLAVLLVCCRALAVTPSAGELEASSAWWKKIFSTNRTALSGNLEVVFEDVGDGFSRGRSWRGSAFQLGEKTYAHGLAFNSTKHIRVRLGQPAKRFTAEVGLENNDDTLRGEAQGHGSVTFHVLVNGKEVFTAPILRRKDGAMPVDLDLHGASEFEIQVKDGGDGRGWDQALWAEATVAFEDGTRRRLQDLPMAGAAEENPFGFSFIYQDQPSIDLLHKWPCELQEQKLEAGRTRRELTWRDPATGLEVRAETVSFGDFPAVEWVVFFRNTSTTNTPILREILAFDGGPVPAAVSPRLHWSKGAVASFDDFAPQEQVMKPGAKLHLQPGGGRSSSQVLPFFNIEGPNLGVIAVIGWSGEWAADFSADTRGNCG